MRSRKELLFTYAAVALSLAVIMVATEIASYYVMVVKRKNFYYQLDLDRLDSPEIKQRFAKVFSYDLGWEPDNKDDVGYRGISYFNQYGYRGAEKNIDGAVMSLFGCSYTVGNRELEKSWAYLLEKKIGRPVLNFGVGGYGTDQAYWRFEKRYIGKLNTPYVCLVVMSENIGRVVNRYRGFYQRNSSLLPTKPMYVMRDDGNIELMPNPLRAPDDIALLKDTKFLEEIGRYDYWYQYYEKFGVNRKISFPYSYYFIKSAPLYISAYYEKRIQYRDDYMDLYEYQPAIAVMKHVISSFISTTKEYGTYPIILFLPNWKDMVSYRKSGTTVYDNLFNDIKQMHEATFDGMDYFKSHMESGKNISEFFVSYADGHYGPLGEQVVSDGFYEDFVSLESRMQGRSR